MCMFYFNLFLFYFFVDKSFIQFYFWVLFLFFFPVGTARLPPFVLANIPYRMGALLSFYILLYSVVNVWRKGISIILWALRSP